MSDATGVMRNGRVAHLFEAANLRGPSLRFLQRVGAASIIPSRDAPHRRKSESPESHSGLAMLLNDAGQFNPNKPRNRAKRHLGVRVTSKDEGTLSC